MKKKFMEEAKIMNDYLCNEIKRRKNILVLMYIIKRLAQKQKGA